MQTYMANPDKIERKWYVVDAEGCTLGRLLRLLRFLLRFPGPGSLEMPQCSGQAWARRPWRTRRLMRWLLRSVRKCKDHPRSA